MLLSGQHRISPVSGCWLRIQMRPLGLAVAHQEEIALRVHPQHRPVSLKAHISERNLGQTLATDSIGVDKTVYTSSHARYDHSLIFAADDRVDAGDAAVQFFELTAKESHRIEEVDERLID